jgi:hypothetical protein
MTTRQFVTLEKRLLPYLLGFAIKGRLLFIRPISGTLRGFWFEGSDFDKNAFYVSAFFMPLYVPAENLHLGFGDRLTDGGADRWSITDAGYESRLLTKVLAQVSWLSSLGTAAQLADALRSFVRSSEPDYINAHAYEALAYTLIRMGSKVEAVETIDFLLRDIDPEIPWQREIGHRAEEIRKKLLVSTDKAKQQLDGWEIQSIQNLGLSQAQDKMRRNS